MSITGSTVHFPVFLSWLFQSVDDARSSFRVFHACWANRAPCAWSSNPNRNTTWYDAFFTPFHLLESYFPVAQEICTSRGTSSSYIVSASRCTRSTTFITVASVSSTGAPKFFTICSTSQSRSRWNQRAVLRGTISYQCSLSPTCATQSSTVAYEP